MAGCRYARNLSVSVGCGNSITDKNVRAPLLCTRKPIADFRFIEESFTKKTTLMD